MNPTYRQIVEMDVKSVTGGSGQPLANANSADAKSRSDD